MKLLEALKTKYHLLSARTWENFNGSKEIDVLLNEQKEIELTKKEQEPQKNHIYKRKLVDIILNLAKGGKSLGHNEKEDGNENGLVLKIVELLKKYVQNLIYTLKWYVKSALTLVILFRTLFYGH